MASKTPADKKPLKADPVTVPLPVAAVIPDAAPAFVPTQAVTKKPADKPAAPGVTAPFAAAPAAAVKPVLAAKPVAAKPVATKPAKPRPVAAPAPAPMAKKRAAPDEAPNVTVPSNTVPSMTAEKPSTPFVAKTPAAPVEEETKMEAMNTASFDNAGATQFAEKAKTMFADAGTKGTQAFADINEFGKGNIEAIVESSKIAAKGVEAMGQDAAEFGRRQFESATAALKSMSAVKSPTDFFKLQSDFIRSSFDSMVAQTSKNTETMLKLAGEVAQPI